jgi:hypothetical protein
MDMLEAEFRTGEGERPEPARAPAARESTGPAVE